VRFRSILLKAIVIAGLLVIVGCDGDGNALPPTETPPTAYAHASKYFASTGEQICFFDYTDPPDGNVQRSFDPDGSIKKWEWDFSYEPSAGFMTESAVIQPCIEYDRKGFFKVQLRVTDDSGNTDMLDTPLPIIVGGGDYGPVARAQAFPLTVTSGEPVHFMDAGSYDPDGGSIVSYEWDWEDDGIYDEHGTDVYHTWYSDGRYDVQFRITDDEGSSNELNRPLEITVQSGMLVWARNDGGEGNDEGRGIAALSDGSTVVTGLIACGAVFGAGEPNETTFDGCNLVFTARYYPDGNLQWAKSVTGYSSSIGYAITALSDNSTVITGLFEGAATFGMGEPNETTLESPHDYAVFTTRYYPDGTLAWAKSAGHIDNDFAYAIAALSDDSVIVTGWYSKVIRFGKGEPNETTLYADGSVVAFIARYNSDGSLAWARNVHATEFGSGYGLVPLSDDSFVLAGYYMDTAVFGVGEPNETTLEPGEGVPDIFIARYSPDGSLIWVVRVASTYDYNFWDDLGLTTLSDNSIVLTGYFKESTVFDEGGPHETILSSAGEHDLFVARYDSDGQLVWAKRAGGMGEDRSYSVTALSDDSAVITGSFGPSATFGQGGLNQTTLISGTNEADIFIARYFPNGELAWARRAGSPNWDCSYGITSFYDDTIAITGTAQDDVTFGLNEPNETRLTTNGLGDIFVARYTP